MCAICGIVYFEKDRIVDPMLVHSMMTSMLHRGPDDEGIYLAGNVALGHRRLSIIDLKTGKQPISNEDGKIWIVFNGEIYNYSELRQHLTARGHLFQTRTDTEVIIHAYEEYGENCLLHFRGMFAFAIWDENQRKLFLARDRVGIKPLYYYISEDYILFSSEIKAILCKKDVPRKINLGIIDRFLTYYYVPGEDTLIQGIKKIEPGYFLTWTDRQLVKKQYWDLKFPHKKSQLNFDEAKERLMELLRETARLHMVSDVPVGLLLSGGVDSSALLALCVNETDKKISTFTIGFDGADFDDERLFARLVAKRYGSKHYETTITPEQFKDFLLDYVWFMEEPVCEPPAVALHYISKIAKSHVKVLISGEGGDEAFAGYPNHRNMLILERLKQRLKKLNMPISIGLNFLTKHMKMFRVQKYARLLTVQQDDYYLSRRSTPYSFFNTEYRDFYSEEFFYEINKNNSILPTHNLSKAAKVNDPLDKMLYVDLKTWLPDDLLIKADKITMANSLELRVPFLDHILLEYAASLPANYKIKGATTKIILKEAFKGYVPDKILKKRKTGFPVPYDRWLKNELRQFVSDILLSNIALNRGYFRKPLIERILRSEIDNYPAAEIFSLITLELWHRTFIDAGSRI